MNADYIPVLRRLEWTEAFLLVPQRLEVEFMSTLPTLKLKVSRKSKALLGL